MGNIKSREMKMLSKKLIEQYPDKFTTDFNFNKKSLSELKVIENKSMRNKVAGYITRLKR